MNTAERAAATLADPRWAAVRARDEHADGHFVYSVSSTGVYCRPSCGSRPARPENVGFHATCAAAETAGFRPCQRCKPEQPPLAKRQAAMVVAACRTIDASEDMPGLDALASAAGVSLFHFQRTFRKITGLTPRAYAAARRAERVRTALRGPGKVTEAIYDAGYNANSRFYEQADQVLGMSPRDFQAGGERQRIHFAIGECSLGAILVARSERGICAILMGDDAQALVADVQDRFPRAELVGGDATFDTWVARVVGFVEQPGLGLDLPLDIRGTAFQERVWQALLAIPVGSTASYTDIAARIGQPSAVRAVAQACGANALAVAIPCHRVVRNDGGLSGYRWGVERKRALLDRERHR
jgi:AraC family transcriptional regulator of adaptative response/methylated-DNA-[protein]-cysteine methyltransferase